MEHTHSYDWYGVDADVALTQRSYLHCALCSEKTFLLDNQVVVRDTDTTPDKHVYPVLNHRVGIDKHDDNTTGSQS